MQTITKVYDSYDQAHHAVEKLETAGIEMSEISVLGSREQGEGSEAEAGASMGATAGGAAGLLAGLGLLAIPGIGPVVAAGWLATMAAGALAGGAAGGILGFLIKSGVPEEHAHVYSEALRRGATLVSVKAEDHEVETVHAVLDDFEPLDPDQQGLAYREEGWNGFNPDGGPYEPIRTAADRDQHIH